MASFVDREFSRGVFTSTNWNVQGNVTADANSGWTDHFTESTAATFQPAVGDVIPGSTRSYSRFGLRVAPGSTVGGTVTMSAGVQVAPSTQAGLFRMRIVRTASTTCALSSFASGATFVVGSAGDLAGNFGTMLSAPNSAGQFTLPATGTPTYLCYEFSLPSTPPSGLTNGAVATVRWTFNATSAAI
ncbi:MULTISPECIES: hypothetical protein [unclassified Dietzia]|nr:MULTISPECIES: hypothetical protein [unclassified Dietzia]AVZ40439.1 hypothetical protein CT688_14160 [Dietzia sp. JS16-p6b]